MPAAPGEHRLFIAVPVDADSIAAVGRLVADVRAAVETDARDRPARWVRHEGLHLTLRFLGAIPEDRRPAIEGALRAAAAGVDRFPVRLAGSGAFPSPGRPRVLWIGVDEGADRLRELAAAVSRALEPLGYPPGERPFAAHLTLARTDGLRSGPPTAAALARAAADWSTRFVADRVTLFESHTGGGPARYEPLLEVPLEA
jgi:2'-5' RNA ligase